MTDHLPECESWMDPAGVSYDADGNRNVCICAPLRACEQRLEDEWLGKYNAAEQRGYDAGFRNGVQAARQAMAAFPGRAIMDDSSYIHRAGALAAIDALRGSGNPDTPPSAEKGEQA